MSWFWRGFQSAVFYYLSCAPCMTCAHQRKRAKANRRARAIKAAQKQEQGIYVHPSPFDTNIYWHEEMLLGPGPPQRKGNKDKARTDSAKRLNTGGHGSSGGGSSADTTLAVQSFESIQEEDEGREDDDWNRKRYQRADEMLWGEDDTSLSSFLYPGSFVGKRPIVNSDGTYYGLRNPAVNDLHPPIVSTQPTNPNSARWMLQPPPTARVMEGKERANRSRSTSRASYTKGSRGTGGAAAGAQVLSRVSREEMSVADSHQPGTMLDQGSMSSLQAKPKRHQGIELPNDIDIATLTSSKRKRPPPIMLADKTNKGRVHPNSNVDESQPQRTTLKSADDRFLTSQDVEPVSSAIPAESHPEPRLGILASASSSLHASQSQVSADMLTELQSNTPSREAGVQLPSAIEAEASFLALPQLESKSPGQDSFQFPSTEIRQAPMPKYVEPNQRWSMDL